MKLAGRGTGGAGVRCILSISNWSIIIMIIMIKYDHDRHDDYNYNDYDDDHCDHYDYDAFGDIIDDDYMVIICFQVNVYPA